MIGIDIAKISRFKAKKEIFLKRILSAEEYQMWDKKDLKFLAIRWAIKEALYKADNSNIHFNQMTIKKRQKKYFYEGYYISTSSEDDIVIAMVIKEKKC